MSGQGRRTWDGEEVAVLAERWGVPKVEAWSRTASTNDRLTELAEGGAPPWTVVLADEQTHGRGRRGTGWVSPPGGGLWMSVLLPPETGPRPLPLVVGLACAEAMEALVPEIRVGLKWPNDLEIDGRKVGGILCEGAPTGTVVGVGINVGEAPPVAGATALPTASDGSSRRSALAASVIRRLRARTEGDGSFGTLLPELRARDVLAGQPVWTEAEGVGVARGIDASGALVLGRDDGATVQVRAGSVRLTSEAS